MPLLLELFLICLLSIFQSVFGVGLLLFGTPLFLSFNYGFSETLSILLPTSISISFFQFFLSPNKDYNYIKEFNFYCIPFLGIFLYLILSFEKNIDFKYWISIVLIISAFITLNSYRLLSLSNLIIKFRKVIYIFIGIIHGLSNMGGSFLSIFASSMSRNHKLLTRQYIAYGYFSMGLIQYLVLLIFYSSNVSFNKVFYILLAIIVYFPSQKIFDFVINYIYVKIIILIAMIFGITILSSYYINI